MLQPRFGIEMPSILPIHDCIKWPNKILIEGELTIILIRGGFSVLAFVFRYFGITEVNFGYRILNYWTVENSTKYWIQKVGWELAVFWYFEPFERPLKAFWRLFKALSSWAGYLFYRIMKFMKNYWKFPLPSGTEYQMPNEIFSIEPSSDIDMRFL